MENKKTSELLDLLWEKTSGANKDNWDDECTEILAELEKREPFFTFTRDNNLEEIPDVIDEIKGDIKLLKRHKHDEKNGDELIRI